MLDELKKALKSGLSTHKDLTNAKRKGRRQGFVFGGFVFAPLCTLFGMAIGSSGDCVSQEEVQKHLKSTPCITEPEGRTGTSANIFEGMEDSGSSSEPGPEEEYDPRFDMNAL